MDRPLAFLLAFRSSKPIKFTGTPSIIANVRLGQARGNSTPEIDVRTTIRKGGLQRNSHFLRITRIDANPNVHVSGGAGIAVVVYCVSTYHEIFDFT